MHEYKQFKVRIRDDICLFVSLIAFKQGTLINSDCARSLAKPEAYFQWRNKRKETFIAGRLAVQHAQTALDLPIEDIGQARDGSPIWMNQYTGSISHTEDQAIAVILPQVIQQKKGIGIDLEKLKNATLIDDPALIGKESEFQILLENGVSNHLLALVLFSLKESVYKALYPTVKCYFDFLDVELIRTTGPFICFKIIKSLTDSVDIGFIVEAGFVFDTGYLLTWAYCSW